MVCLEAIRQLSAGKACYKRSRVSVVGEIRIRKSLFHVWKSDFQMRKSLFQVWKRHFHIFPQLNAHSFSVLLYKKLFPIRSLRGGELSNSVGGSLSVLAMIGARAVETFDRAIGRSGCAWIRCEHDGLIASHCSAVRRVDVVSHGLQLTPDQTK